MIKIILPILALTFTLFSCANPSAGSGVPGFFNDVKEVSAGGGYTVAIKNDGSLWTWGNNVEGQLGDNTTFDNFIPILVEKGYKWKKISAGGEHTVAIREDGSLWVWGSNYSGQLGDGGISGANSDVPVQLAGAFGGYKWKEIAAGSAHTVAIKEDDGTIWAWGDNVEGQLGNGGTSSSNVPVPLTGAFGGYKWKKIAAGRRHTAAIKEDDNTIWAWGSNETCQLGNGGSYGSSSNVPVPLAGVFGGYKWKEIAAGERHTAAIDEDGKLWSWGYNVEGQLGDDGSCGFYSNVPVALAGAFGGYKWKKISAGSAYTAAIDEDATIWAWGENYNGQLGDGTTTISNIPIKIGDRWENVSAGGMHTVAIKRDGVL